MYYIKNKIEQEKVTSKIKHLYTYDYIELQNIELYKEFKYATFIEDLYCLNKTFNTTLSEFVDSNIEKKVYLFIADNNSIDLYRKESHIYPTIVMNIHEVKNGLINTLLPGNHPIDFEGTNICLMPSSFNWLFCLNKDNELGCFLSNDKRLNISFTKLINSNAGDKITYNEKELIKEFNIAKNKDEYDKLPIAKLEII